MPDETDDFYEEWRAFYECFTAATDTEVELTESTARVARKVAYLPD